MPMFRDRKDAGERLAAQLLHLKDRSPVVLALPRGGVAIGAEIARLLGALLDFVREETARQLAELERRRESYCAGRPPVEIAGRTAIVVDDGIATGATMRVALRAVRRHGPARLILAAPVAAAETLAALSGE